MFVTAIVGAIWFLGMPAVNAVGAQLWVAGEDYLLLSIPLYILLGEILVHGGAADKMYQSLADWLGRLPGGLLHTNIGASALFSAVSGSSVATAATIATVVDYLVPYLSDPHKWSKEQIADFSNDGLYFLAFAGMGLKKPEYVALYRKLERPEGAWLATVDLIVARWEASGHQTRH